MPLNGLGIVASRETIITGTFSSAHHPPVSREGERGQAGSGRARDPCILGSLNALPMPRPSTQLCKVQRRRGFRAHAGTSSMGDSEAPAGAGPTWPPVRWRPCCHARPLSSASVSKARFISFTDSCVHWRRVERLVGHRRCNGGPLLAAAAGGVSALHRAARLAGGAGVDDDGQQQG